MQDTQKRVLVSVLKSKSDLRILLRDHWYRIPVAFMSRRHCTHVAFYQPMLFGKRGKRIVYYGRIAARSIVERIALLPHEPRHPRAHDLYLKIVFRRIQKLSRPIRNIIPRRVSFGFTSMKNLLSAGDILELYGVPPTEKIIEACLRRRGVKTVSEYTVSAHGRRCRIDIAVWCKNGAVAIECDNDKAHSSKVQRQKDASKDIFLKRLGWRVMRFKEKDIVEHADRCVMRVQKAIRVLGGKV